MFLPQIFTSILFFYAIHLLYHGTSIYYLLQNILQHIHVSDSNISISPGIRYTRKYTPLYIYYILHLYILHSMIQQCQTINLVLIYIWERIDRDVLPTNDLFSADLKKSTTLPLCVCDKKYGIALSVEILIIKYDIHPRIMNEYAIKLLNVCHQKRE